MRKLILMLIILINLFGQSLELIGPPGGFVRGDQLAIHPSSPNVVYSATWLGALFRSDNSGTTVEPIETYLQDFRINRIDLSNSDLKTILIQAWYTFLSTDSGVNWKLIESQPVFSYFKFNPKNRDIIYRTMNSTELWRSHDFGESWKLLHTFDKDIKAYTISTSDTAVIYLSTLWNNIYKSNNSGKNWELVSTDAVEKGVTQIEISPYNNNTIYVNSGGIHKSNNSGKTFKSLLEVRDLNTFVVNPLDTLTLYAAIGDYLWAPEGGIIKTTDEGENWTTIVNGIEGNYVTANTLKMNPQNPEELYAGIGSLGVYKTTNGGDNWYLTNLAYSDVSSIYVDEENPGTIITGQYGWSSMKTTNFGENWEHPQFDVSYQHLTVYDIDFNPFNKDQGYLLTKEMLFITEDRGYSWEAVPNDLEILRVLSFHPTVPDLIYGSTFESAFFEGGSNAIYRSTDNGETWQNVRNTHVTRFRFDKNNDNIIYGLGGSSSILHRSTDYGETWEVILRGEEFPEFEWLQPSDFEVSEVNPNNMYISFKEGMLLYSEDRGESWSRIDNSLKDYDKFAPFSDIWLDDRKSGRLYAGIYGGGQPTTENFTNGGLYLTEDNGKHWRQVYDSEVNVIEADNESPRNIYVGTKFGIKTFVDTLTVTSIRNDEEETLPSEYVLYQNYPNPFNPSTQIKFTIPKAENVNLKIFDMLGKEVISLVDGYKNAGTYKVQFDASRLASGIYLYRLKTSAYTNAKKLILIK